MILQEILGHLRENFLYNQYVEKIEIYKNQVVYIDIKTEQLFFALDINENYEIFLVCRNVYTQKFFCQYFNCFVDFKLKVFSKNKVLVDFLNIEYDSNIYKVVGKIIKKLLAYTQDQKYLLNTLTSQVMQLNKHIIAAKMNDIYLDMANTLSDKFLT